MALDQFQSDLEDNYRAWHSQAILPYIHAYDNAWAEYQKTISAQDKLDEAQQQLFTTAVAIISTSGWMAAVASPALRKGIMKIGLRTLGFQNTKAILVKILAMRDNPIVSFAIGQVAGKVHDSLNSTIAGAVAKLHENTKDGVAEIRPLGRLTELEAILEQQTNCVSQIYKAVIKAVIGGPPGAQRDSQLQALRATPLMNPPRNSLSVDHAYKKILLGMYMQKVLDGDYKLFHFPPDGHAPPPQRGGWIDQMPSDPSYPRSQTFRETLGGYTTVEVDRPGAEFEKATDAAYAALYNQPFYNSHWKFVRDTPGLNLMWMSEQQGSVEELKKAESTLRTLSNTTRPPDLSMVMA